MEINTKMHWLDLSTMIHLVRNQIKYILVNERPRDSSRARLRDLMEELEITEKNKNKNNRNNRNNDRHPYEVGRSYF